MNEYRSCNLIEEGIFFNHLNKVGYCCMLTPSGGQPVLYENYAGELIDWDEFFKNREKHISLMKEGSELPACKDCVWIQHKIWEPRKKEFRFVLLNIWTKCNLYCVYCLNHTDKNVLNNTKEYNIIPVLKDMIDKGLINENTKIEISGGEATLDKNFEELLDLLINSRIRTINVNTNATVYSDSLRNGIRKGVVSIISSIDSGTASQFYRVKKQNLWNKVWSNLKIYSSAAKKNNNKLVRTKYIILPKINDKKREISSFIFKSKKIGVNGTILNIDLHWLRKNSNDIKTMYKILNLVKHFVKVCSILNIDYDIWKHLEELNIRYNKLNPNKQDEFDFVFSKDKKVQYTYWEIIKIRLEYLFSFISFIL